MCGMRVFRYYQEAIFWISICIIGVKGSHSIIKEGLTNDVIRNTSFMEMLEELR